MESEKKEAKETDKGLGKMAKCLPKLGYFVIFLHLLSILSIFALSSCCTTPLLLSLYSHRVPWSRYAIFPIFNTTLASSEGMKVTQAVYFPWRSWGGQSWDTRPAGDNKSAVSQYISCMCE